MASIIPDGLCVAATMGKLVRFIRLAILSAVGWMLLAAVIFFGVTAVTGNGFPFSAKSVTENGTPGPKPGQERSAAGGGQPGPAQPGSPKTTVFSQEQINTQIAQVLQEKGSSAPVRDVQVTLLDRNRLQASGRAAIGGQGDIPLTLEATVSSQNGKLQVDVTSANSGFMPLPSIMVADVIQQALAGTGYSDLSNIRLPADVESVEVQQGQVVIRRK